MPPTWPSALAALLASLALAGCLSPASPAPTPASAAPEDPAPASFLLSGTDCEEGGFVAAYGEQNAPTTLAEVWVLADIREEIGNPIHDAVGVPVTGPLVGNWHMGFRCASVAGTGGEASGFVFGYVGSMVETPPWDPGGADLHFLVSGLGFADGDIAEALRATTTADVTPAVEARVDWLLPKDLPRSAAYAVYVDGKKGVYESWSTMALLRQSPERTLRLWWQVPVDGTRDDHAHHNAMQDLTFNRVDEEAEGRWHPVFWDLHVSGGPQYTTPPADGVQFGTHNMLGFEHGPVAGQPTLTNVYHHASLTFASGHVVRDVVLARMWNH